MAMAAMSSVAVRRADTCVHKCRFVTVVGDRNDCGKEPFLVFCHVTVIHMAGNQIYTHLEDKTSTMGQFHNIPTDKHHA